MHKKSLSIIAGLLVFTLGLGFFFLAPSTTVNAASAGCDYLDAGPYLSDAVNHQFYTNDTRYFEAGDVISWDMYSGEVDGYTSQVVVNISLRGVDVINQNNTGDQIHVIGSYEVPSSDNYRVNIYAHEGPAWTATGTSTLGGTVACADPTPPDADNDTIEDANDNCPNDANPDQADVDGDNIGDACDPLNDNDNDTIDNSVDNCPAIPNADQADVDGDNIGDACDGLNDNDNDTIDNSVDNCPNDANSDQADVDGDNIGDACDGLNDNDNDGIANNVDNCVATYNPDQIDADGDGRGDVCDQMVNTDGRLNFQMADTNAVLYRAQDDAGNPAMQVYCTTADATGFLALVISQVDLPEVAPAENTLVATSAVCNVEFWALADGSQFRYQVNVGPNIDGNTYEFLFNSIGGADIQLRSFNQYEMGN